MKTLYTLLLLSAFAFISACSETEKAPQESETSAAATYKEKIRGRWKLTREERRKTREKGVEYAHQPTNVILYIQKNGYFTIYDTFTDPKWKEKGLPLIQRRAKGQWKIEGKQLSLTHLSDDTSYTEELEITSLSDSELVTRGKNNHSNVYKTYGK